MHHELEVWFDIARNGSTTPPRFRPRSDSTVRSQLGYALPIIRAWARTHASLREIGRDDVLAALPPSGSPRTSTLQGLRSIFRILKARKLTFINPTTRMSVPTPDKPVPAPIDLTELRDALNSGDPTRAALAGLLAFHAVRIWQLLQLQVTDVRDGRLYLPNRIVRSPNPSGRGCRPTWTTGNEPGPTPRIRTCSSTTATPTPPHLQPRGGSAGASA